MPARPKYVLDFTQVDKDDIAHVGGKGANLGEMTQAGFPVPPGFIVTSHAYYYFLKVNQLKDKLTKELFLLDHHDPENLQRITERIRQHIIGAEIPKDLGRSIIKAYEKLGGKLKHALVAVRSSATAEDLPDASFAGQQETFLNISGEATLIEHVRLAWASLFTPRATFYRAEKGFDHLKVGIAVPIQKMIQSDVSGVMFTIDPVKNDKTKIVIEAIYGLGELIVQGTVTPDRYQVDKNNYRILEKHINSQSISLIKSGKTNKERSLTPSQGKKQKLSDQKIVELAKIGKNLHQHYFFPQDIEWALEKETLYILQTRPVTTIKQVAGKKEPKEKKINLPIIVTGKGASPGLASGKAQIVGSAKEISKVDQGEILITSMTTPDFVPAMRKAIAIVTDEGGVTSHAAIVSRELGVPCIVGTDEASKKIKTGQVITVDGQKGLVYKGALSPATQRIASTKTGKRTLKKKGRLKKGRLKTATKVFVNLAEPELAKKVSRQDVDGIGLLRAEFMIAQIGTHPKRLIASGKQEVFIKSLTKGILAFAKTFSPRPVIYRSTDFKTNEYRNLAGGREFEPDEDNPMIGFRGAYRYLIQPEVFELELEAIKRVRNKHGYRNLHLMLPFVRTVKELKEIKKLVLVNNLNRSPSFKLFMMVEVPSNVIILDQFIKAGIDGISIGSNDLTQLILGVDRDNEDIETIFNEQDRAVLWAIKRSIRIANKYQIHSSICGQAPSLYPELTEKLVKWGISAVSVSPDMIETTREIISQAERRLITQR